MHDAKDLIWIPKDLKSCCYLVTKLCLTVYDPMDCGLQGSSVNGISLAKILNRLPCTSPRVLPYPEIKPGSPALAGRLFTLREVSIVGREKKM